MEFTLIKEGVPYSEIDRADNIQVVRWFSIMSEINKKKNEDQANQMRMQ